MVFYADSGTPFRAGTIFIADTMTQRGRRYLPPSQHGLARCRACRYLLIVLAPAVQIVSS